MPIEIRELIIRAQVDPHPGGRSGSATGPPVDQQELIRACVQEVLRVLAEKQER